MNELYLSFHCIVVGNILLGDTWIDVCRMAASKSVDKLY